MQKELAWQSKLVLLLVLPFVGVGVLLETRFWATWQPAVAIWTLGLSALLGVVTWRLRAATPAAAAAGAAITANLMFSTTVFPYRPWHTAIIPVLAVSLLAFVATLIGREKKERLGTAEKRQGRSAAQVSANLGIAALVSNQSTQIWLTGSHWFAHVPVLLLTAALAALAEAAADTVSSEAGQVFGGRPRMITTLRSVDPGRDGALSPLGTLAGIAAAGIVAAAGTLALGGNARLFTVSCAGGIFGLLFDSLLGATLEEHGWLNNDTVNFLSTASAASFAMAVLAFLS
jgi:uncharacterized protein (TIGR00297 family)